MRYSKYPFKTRKTVGRDLQSKNARLLTQAGFIHQEVAGVYSLLPLGLRVVNKIANIVREEMNTTGAYELLLTSLQNKESWEKTKRWKSFDALFKVKSRFDTEYALGPTHEEVIVPLVKQFVSSYKDLPLYLYQIQTKFRDEPRAKSGILRGREFLMKDLYSFHVNEEDFNKYYEIMKKAYQNVFKRCGLDSILTQASGGAFSKFSHEFQVITENGEDEIIYCPGGDFSANIEISPVKEGKQCDLGHGPLKRAKTIEVGNIFPLKIKFSDAFNLTYKNKEGKDIPVIMGCYGIGITRLMGAVVEVYHDEKGIVWPEEVAPFDAHLVHLGGVIASPARRGQLATPEVRHFADKTYETLKKAGVEVLYDDRDKVSAGEKFADCDLIGIPVRLVVSEKTADKIEWKKRTHSTSSRQAKTELLGIGEVLKRLT